MELVDRRLGAHRLDIGHSRRERVGSAAVLDGRAHGALPLAELGACALAAVSAHANRRGWDLGYVMVQTTYHDEGSPCIARLVEVGQPLDDRQHAELVFACGATPLTRTVEARIAIATLILDDGLGLGGLGEELAARAWDVDAARAREEAIDRALEDSFPASDPPSWTSCSI